MLAVRWLEANADTSEQETAVPTPEQLSNVKMAANWIFSEPPAKF